MSTVTEEREEEFTERTWSLRKAESGDDWQGLTPEPGKNYWVRVNTDGRCTKVCATPAEAFKETVRLDREASAPEPEHVSDHVSDTEEQPLATAIVAELRAADTPSELREVIRRRGLGDVMNTEPDPRYTEDEQGAIGETLHECATRLGVSLRGQDMIDAAAYDADDKRADTAEAYEPGGGGEEQPDGFPNPGAGFSRSLAEPAPESLFPTPGEPAVPPLVQQIHPSKITTHPSTLMRAGGLHEEHVEDLEAVLRAGGRLPAVDLYYDGFTYWIGDGNHRHAAAERAGALLDAVVHPGSLRDAILHAVRANAEHGLKRTNDDKRLAVVTLLLDEEWAGESDTTVASLAGVTQPFVGKVQAWLTKLLPVLDGDGVEDPSDVPDEEFAERAGVPEGLVAAVRGLTDDRLASLTANVMARAESRTSAGGKKFSVERPAADEPPPLLEGVEPAQEEPPVGAQEPAGEAVEASAETEAAPAREEAPAAEAGRPEIQVNDRRTFASETPAAAPQGYTGAPPSQQHATERQTSAPAPAAPKRPSVEELLKGRKMTIGLIWIPALKGKVSVSVTIGDDVSKGTRSLLPMEKLTPLSEELMRMISEQATAAGKSGTAKVSAAKTAAKPAAKKPAGKSAAKKSAAKKGAAKQAAKKSAAKKSSRKR